MLKNQRSEFFSLDIEASTFFTVFSDAEFIRKCLSPKAPCLAQNAILGCEIF